MTTAVAQITSPAQVRANPALWAFRHLARRRIATQLDGLYLAGLRRAQSALERGPVLFAATHVSRWDPLVLLVLDEALGAEGRALMDAANLDRLPFFRWLGAMPIDRSGRARARSGLRDAAAWLDRPGRSLWVFPQGRQRPAHLRPLGLERGTELITRASGATIIPVALNYGFREHDCPAAVACFGGPLDPAPTLLAALEPALADGLARIDLFLDGQPGDFEALVPPNHGPTDTDLPTRLLAAIARMTT